MRRRLSPLQFLAISGFALCWSMLEPPPHPEPFLYKADPGTLLLLGVGLAAAAGFLLKNKKVGGFERDSRPPALVERGSQLPYLIGRRIVQGGPVWVGRRNTKTDKQSMGKGFGSGSGSQITYYEDAVHVISLGPVNALYRIQANRETIFTGPISPDTTPSGSYLQTTEGDTFRIFWGNETQPINTSLAESDALGVASSWPFVCYVHWIQKNLGSSATWPQLDYDAESTCVGSTLPDSECVIDESTSGAGDGGANGAHVLYQLISGPYPHGAGASHSCMDYGSLRALGELIESERIPMNILIAEDASLLDILDDILTDLGVFLAEEQGKLVFMPIRSGQPVYTLDERMVVLPRPSVSVSHESDQTERIVFLFPSLANDFYPTDLILDDSATARAMKRKNTRTETIDTITSIEPASACARRRQQLFLSNKTTISFWVTRTARRLVVGQAINIPGVGTARVTSISPNATTKKSNVEASLDVFSLPASEWVASGADGSGSSASASPDSYILPFEVPHEFAGEQIKLGVLRAREDGQSMPAEVWVSTNGTNYSMVGHQDAVGALVRLSSPWAPDDATISDDELAVAATPAAAATVTDLSGDDASWLGGEQILTVGEELTYLKSISSLGGGLYSLGGLVRGRSDSLRAAHALDDWGIIAWRPGIKLHSSAVWGPGTKLWVKVRPEGVQLEDCSASTLTLTGKALGPLPIDNFGPTEYLPGEDIDFTWTDRIRKGSLTGAGEGVSGEPQPETPAIEGDFLIEILLGSGLVVRSETVSTLSWTYTASDRSTDSINDTSFSIRITPRKNGFGACPRTFIIEGTD